MSENRIEGTLTAMSDFVRLTIKCLGVPLAVVSPDIWAAIRPDRPWAAKKARKRRGAGDAEGGDVPSVRAAAMAACAAQLKCSGSNSPSRGCARQGRKVALPPSARSPSWRRGQWPRWGASTRSRAWPPGPVTGAAAAAARPPPPPAPPPAPEL